MTKPYCHSAVVKFSCPNCEDQYMAVETYSREQPSQNELLVTLSKKITYCLMFTLGLTSEETVKFTETGKIIKIVEARGYTPDEYALKYLGTFKLNYKPVSYHEFFEPPLTTFILERKIFDNIICMNLFSEQQKVDLADIIRKLSNYFNISKIEYNGNIFISGFKTMPQFDVLTRVFSCLEKITQIRFIKSGAWVKVKL